MRTIFILNERVLLDNKHLNIKIDEINTSTYIIQAPTTDIADLIEFQLKKQLKEYTKVVTGGVLFAPYIIEGNSTKVIYFELNGNEIITYGENGASETLENPDRVIEALGMVESTEAKVFFKSKVIPNMESALGHMYDKIKCTHIPDEDTVEFSSESAYELEGVRRVLNGINADYCEVHYGSTFTIPNVYVKSLNRVIYFNLDDNGQYVPLYTKEDNNEVRTENVAFLNSFEI